MGGGVRRVNWKTGTGSIGKNLLHRGERAFNAASPSRQRTMPHFENIKDYESGDPVSGSKKVIPIAPHSMGVQEYRPRKREALPKQKDTLPPFPGVDVEPVSISQMEKEFRQAAKADEKKKKARRRKGFRSLWRRVLGFLGIASKPSGPKGRNRDKPNRPQKGGDRNAPARRQGRNQRGGPKKRAENRPSSGGGEGRKPSGKRGNRGGRNRSGGGGSGGGAKGGGGAPRGGPSGGQGQNRKPESGKQAPRKRPRRNRKPSGQQKPPPSNSKSKDA